MDTVLGLIELVAYIAFILALSAGATFAVVRISPVRDKTKASSGDSV